jgi:hypothetical protein
MKMTKNLDKKIQFLAAYYYGEFETNVDSEWSATAYEDLGELKNEMDWAEFHYALETEVKNNDARRGIDPEEMDYSTFVDGVFVI